DRFGHLDILVNNAGASLGAKRLAEVAIGDWRANFDLNVTAAFLCARAALPPMRAQRSGPIVHVASGAGRRPTVGAGAAYSSAKAALVMLNTFLNLEERRHGVRSSVIILGTTDTPAHVPGGSHPISPEARATWMRPDDVADTVVF